MKSIEKSGRFEIVLGNSRCTVNLAVGDLSRKEIKTPTHALPPALVVLGRNEACNIERSSSSSRVYGRTRLRSVKSEMKLSLKRTASYTAE